MECSKKCPKCLNLFASDRKQNKKKNANGIEPTNYIPFTFVAFRHLCGKNILLTIQNFKKYTLKLLHICLKFKYKSLSYPLFRYPVVDSRFSKQSTIWGFFAKVMFLPTLLASIFQKRQVAMPLIAPSFLPYFHMQHLRWRVFSFYRFVCNFHETLVSIWPSGLIIFKILNSGKPRNMVSDLVCQSSEEEIDVNISW